MISENTLTIIPFSSENKEAIKTLNFAWLNKHFRIEAKDELVLSNPQGEIIDKGGFVFYAKYQGEIVGTVSLLRIDDSNYELSKMAVKEGFQGLGIGQKLLEHCFLTAKENNIPTLILYSNRILLRAIYLYEKFGFREVALESGIYERADIKMEKNIS